MAEALATASVDIRANTVTMAKDLKQAVSLWEKAGKDLESVRDKIAKRFYFDIGRGLYTGVKTFGKALGELVEEGERVGSIRDSFRALGGSASSIDEARKKVVGLVDSFDLMQIANKGLLAQIPGFQKEFSNIADLGGRIANTFGKDTKQSIEDLTTAIVKGQAKGLTPLGFSFTDTSNKALVTQQALAQVKGVLGNLPEVSDSAANAFTSLKNTLGEAVKQIGIGVNESPQLVESIRNFERIAASTNWGNFAQDLATIAAALMDIGTTVLPIVVAGVKNFAAALDYVIGTSAEAKFNKLSLRIGEIKEQMDSLQAVEDRAMKERGGEGGLSPQGADALSKLKEEYSAAMTEAAKLNEQILKTKEGAKGIAQYTPTMFGAAFQSGADKAKEKLESIRDSWKKTTESIEKKTLEDALENAVRNLDLAKFDELKSKLAKSVEEGFVLGQKKAIEAGVVDEAAVRELGAEQGRIAAEEWQPKMEDAMKESVDTWRTLFQNAITGVSFNLRDMLEQVAVGFAAQMAQATMGSLSEILGGSISSPMDIGGLIAQSLGFSSGAGGGGLGGAGGIAAQVGLGSVIGSFGTSAAAAHAAGIAGPAMANGMFAGGTGMLGALGPWGVAGIGALAIGSQTNWFGLGGMFKNKQHPDTKARNKVKGLFEEKGLAGFDFGAAQFNPGGRGFEAFNKLDIEAKQSFGGIGEYIKDMLEITEDIGPQIASILTDGIGGSAEKLGSVMKKLGITVQSVEEHFLAAGKAGAKSWLEVEGAISGAERAATAGQQSMTAAVTELIDSAGRGQMALDGIRDTAIAAQKAGAKTMEDYQKQLALGGMNQEGIDQIMKALAQRGITNLDQLTQSSDRTAGAVVADLDAMGFGFNKMAEQVNEATTAISKFADAVAAIPGVPTPANVDEPRMASGGVLHGPTRVMAGEAGPEAIMPLRRVNGRLGVVALDGGGGRGRGGDVIINAQWAAAGVENRLRQVSREIEDRAVRRSLAVVNERNLRMSR